MCIRDSFGTLEVVDVEGLNEENFILVDNILSVSQAARVEAKSDLFKVTLRARDNGELADNLTIDTKLNGEAYGVDEAAVYQLQLASKSNHFTLYPNHPNPFNEYTFIKYELKRDADVTIELFNVKGSLLRSINTEGIVGMNMVKINREDLSPGLIFCKVESDGHILMKEMIVTD